MEELAVKLYRLFAVCCAWAWLAAGLASGQTMPRHRYYGNGPDISPPYWEVPDLTKPHVPEPKSTLDLTNKTQQVTGYEDMIRRRRMDLRGEEVGHPKFFTKSRTYIDHSVDLLHQNWFRYRSSADILQNSPTVSSTTSRYNESLRYWEIARYRSLMGEFMQQRQSYQPR
jgi:hypothetical protein